MANIMVISVLERRSEIGLRRALGATRGQIRAQFLAEAILLSLAGAVGVILGTVAVAIYARTHGKAVVIPPQAWGGGLAAALVIGVLGGLLPAIRAARLSPVQSLLTVWPNRATGRTGQTAAAVQFPSQHARYALTEPAGMRPQPVGAEKSCHVSDLDLRDASPDAEISSADWAGVGKAVMMTGEGSVFRRCGCTDPVTGRQPGTRCPRLAAGGRHGSWCVRLELPAGLDGRRRRIRRGGYPSRKAALEVLGRLRAPKTGGTSGVVTVGDCPADRRSGRGGPRRGRRLPPRGLTPRQQKAGDHR